ncbi:hypothetical protein Cflav_PD0824 [Pedosphaera parvula Ellin514]|uniref:Uncharacterized protein n=1 Tax=Pedosphaera parvula (strain Ellin514) TaxID=320771 RepID=B9XQR0_PEDPL|nr:hypothetical protein Cflav_PD0824 [Pedosphaera parvula Ellin514]
MFLLISIVTLNMLEEIILARQVIKSKRLCLTDVTLLKGSACIFFFTPSEITITSEAVLRLQK